jgi:hypothetical protein
MYCWEDRNDLKAWHGGDDLVRAVASVNNNTVCFFLVDSDDPLF